MPSFVPAASYFTGSSLGAVAVGDFNNDAIPDLVAVTYNNGNVSVLLGNGDGAFQAARTVAGALPGSLALGDFNGDGKLDLVTANGNDTGSVLLGNGDGTFRQAQGFTLPKHQTSGALAVGDFNSDGKLDLVVSGRAGGTPSHCGRLGCPPTTSSYVNVLLGGGDGSFRASSTIQFSESAYAFALGDFNRDSKLDILARVPQSNRVYLLLGNGDGTLQKPAVAAQEAGSVAVADFNGDGNLDFATPSNLYPGNGNGTFQTPRALPVEVQPVDVAVGDFNRDGKLDLVSANGVVGTSSVFLGNGDGTFQTARNFAAGSYPISVVVGDFNRDGYPDLIMVNNDLIGSPGSLSVLLNDGNW